MEENKTIDTSVNKVSKGSPMHPTNCNVPLEDLKQKLCLSFEQAARYSGIGIKKLRKIAQDPNCPFVMKSGKKRLIKREAFEEYIRTSDEI